MKRQLEIVASQDSSGLVVVMAWDGRGGRAYNDPVFFAGMLDQAPIKLEARTIAADDEYGGVRCLFSDKPLQGLVLAFYRNHGSNTILIKDGGWQDRPFPRGCFAGIPSIAERYMQELDCGRWPLFTWYES